MALDMNDIHPDARAAFIKDGMCWSSEDTLDQANQTLNAHADHGTKLAAFGFSAEDAAELADARDALIAAGVGREAKRTNKKSGAAALAAAMREGQGARLRARSILGNARRICARAGDLAVVQKIDALLERESLAAEDADGLAKQLDALQALLKDPAIADATKTRGGPEAIADAESRAKALRDAAQAHAAPRGTPVETEALDLVDGIILALTRSAREAAEAAARVLAEPALATAFELSALYKRRPKKKVEEQPAAPTGG